MLCQPYKSEMRAFGSEKQREKFFLQKFFLQKFFQKFSNFKKVEI
tara:strand:- start:5284 stop:5418 length:135 start_codon:yes stop_codon:yes gene_type:complete